MAVTIVMKVVHTEHGLELSPEIQAPANGHCACEMMFATTTVKAAMNAINRFNQLVNRSGENKYVH
ncbi:TPA: hypothetical protein M4731_001391 [Salmonella enterica]|nr:hypothetical protein [Salmonella enterica]MCH5735390.1 hypothetical protein [Salmonella enterica]MCH5741824.1 hypothetical protein [Salmonella enterica]MCH5746922.1 hypothetical protein [Salmonella enterica]MCH5757104.1 hypothetical protein [Salmonella enterica]